MFSNILKSTLVLISFNFGQIGDESADIFDSLHGLLHNLSDAYQDAFYASVQARLDAAPDEEPAEQTDLTHSPYHSLTQPLVRLGSQRVSRR